MKFHLVNTVQGLIPATDDDYEKKHSLQLGEVYEVSIQLSRNYEFHKKYFKLINVAWEFMREDQHSFFRENKNSFRKTIEIASGHYERVYSIKRKEWLEVPKSIAFNKMGAYEFSELYERVKDTLYNSVLRGISREDFEEVLLNF
jgi:hypothetical protein